MKNENSISDRIMTMRYFDAITVGDYRYFSEASLNGFFRQNIIDNEIEFIGYFLGEDIEQELLHREIIYIGEELFFIPFNGRKVGVYNLAQKSFDTIEIKNDEVVSFSKAHRKGKIGRAHV